VILSDTGRQHDGRPVVVRASQPEHVAVLSRGFSGRLLRLYQLAQRFAAPKRPPQPAYLLLSDNEGGFPRFGFELDGQVYPDAAYVDLHRRSDLSGWPGAMDQIFPHELLHIIVKVLAGDAPEGHASQVHAIAVRTDRVTAFNEGFAEHGQLMAIDADDAVPETRAMASDVAARDQVFAQFEAFHTSVAARWAIAPKARMTFPFWFSRGEQALRYHGVKENLFAREPEVPAHLLTNRGAYEAYLIENVVPGRAGNRPKPAARLLDTEGVVSTLFYRLVNTPVIRETPRDAAFYARFGTTRAQVQPLDNAYLKVFAAIHDGGYDASGVVDAYGRLFPDERASADAVRRDVLLGQEPPASKEIWLLNADFKAGTTLFDQYRGVPRAHAFDLNASSPADLAGVRGMSQSLASAILARVPYASIEDLERIPGMTPQVIAAFQEMRRAMEVPPAPGTSDEGSLSFKKILMPYAWRALVIWLIGAVAAGALYRVARRVSWWRLLLNGLGAAFVGLVAGWTIDTGTGVLALALPLALFGVPGAIIGMWRARSIRAAGPVLAAWALASLVPLVLVRPIG
jgi:hypothetical protein